MTTIAGTWHIRIATPIGTQAVTLELTERDGLVEGLARGAAETIPLRDVTLDGNRLTWAQSITRPMRLNLTFDVTVDGDTIAGTSRAGRVPASRVTGTRAV